MEVYVIALIYGFFFQNADIAVGNFRTRKEYFIVERNKKIRSVDLTTIGRMSQTQCAAFCVQLSDRCCEITYITSTQECKLDQSGCCDTDFDYVFGSNLLHPSSKYGVNKTLSVTNGGGFGVWTSEEFCTKGHYAIGFRMKIEGPHADRSELNAIEIICGSRVSDRCGDTASSGQQIWGDWTGEAICPAKTFLIAFSLQVHPYNGYEDSTGANYVRFRCRYFKDEFGAVDLSYPPGIGPYGSYGEWSDSCPVNSAICGLQTKIEAVQGYGDDTALNDVKFFCCE
ncbi:Vitelline membrane outer layer protein 1 homolog [Mytilus coruscus]|uniref:Vitelline membrane outer layer protein 1 homolog n=1 Tax=Mytilus coruscus TaxID=42192 RepID=A0A6J8E5D3_MYTCO|nr:Vitelline membrane outer layer protein 1 homolog [Mytilus coruscus]